MGTLLDALIELARFSRTDLRRTAVDLTAAVRRVAAELQQDDPEREVELVISHSSQHRRGGLRLPGVHHRDSDHVHDFFHFSAAGQ